MSIKSLQHLMPLSMVHRHCCIGNLCVKCSAIKCCCFTLQEHKGEFYSIFFLESTYWLSCSNIMDAFIMSFLCIDFIKINIIYHIHSTLYTPVEKFLLCPFAFLCRRYCRKTIGFLSVWGFSCWSCWSYFEIFCE